MNGGTRSVCSRGRSPERNWQQVATPKAVGGAKREALVLFPKQQIKEVLL